LLKHVSWRERSRNIYKRYEITSLLWLVYASPANRVLLLPEGQTTHCWRSGKIIGGTLKM